MHKLTLESLVVTSFEAAPAVFEFMDSNEPTHPRCSVGATGCEYCNTSQTQEM